MFGYALLGAGWLILKTEGELQRLGAPRRPHLPRRRAASPSSAVSIWTPLADAGIAQRWFSWPNIAFSSPVPIITAAYRVAEWCALDQRARARARSSARSGCSLMSFLGIAISLWPMIVPYHYTLWQAASSEARRPSC